MGRGNPASAPESWDSAAAGVTGRRIRPQECKNGKYLLY